MLMKQLSTLQSCTILMSRNTIINTNLLLGTCHHAIFHVVSLFVFSVPSCIVELSGFSGWTLVFVKLQQYP